jgi:VanZ family protein
MSSILFLCVVPKLRILLKYWLPVGAWMAVIFFASGDRMSFQHSSRIVAPLLHWLWPQLSPEAIHTVVVLVRKAGHLTEYALLALLIWRALRHTPSDKPRPWSWRLAARTLLWVMLYAASDEFHQLFVPSREATITDVLIDTTGGALALCLLWSIDHMRRRAQ